MRKRLHHAAAAVALLLLLAAWGGGCAARNRPTGPVIVYLVSRTHVTIVTSGPRGPVYTVRQRSGDTFVEGVTLPELRSRHPDLYRQIEPTLAAHERGRGEDGDAGPTIDASLGHQRNLPETMSEPGPRTVASR